MPVTRSNSIEWSKPYASWPADRGGSVLQQDVGEQELSVLNLEAAVRSRANSRSRPRRVVSPPITFLILFFDRSQQVEHRHAGPAEA